MDDLRTRLAAALADRYALEGLAGQGGMATVYRATDLKHQRPVAIKVLRPELAASIGSERFLREIELSAQLQHPHIVPLYDSGDAGGILYYIMPFVEGESLRDRLSREGKLPFEEAVRLTREVASGLAYAHARGVVHRDIKPENIMLSGGNAVVADFGIARALTAAQQDQSMTGLGMAIGTPAYMSPEQATASEADGRSDQYSLAVVFYEMVTGATPFAATTPQAVLTKALTAVRPKLSRVTRTTPVEADTPLARALDTDPARRFASVTEFADALERSAGGGAGAVAERQRLRRLVIGLPVAVAVLALGWILFGPTRSGPVVEGAESIAVLPFSTSGPGIELMGEGMVDLLSTNLNAVGGIRAADPRQVLARWKKSGGTGGADVEAALAVARGVKASAALVGSIVATGGSVRVSADLYGQDGKSLGHAQVDGAADSVLALVDELSLSLVREIWRSKEPVPSLRVSGLTTTSLAAMREYLVGEQHYRRSEWDSAAAAFTRAIEQDSTFALAHYRLASSVGWSGGLTAVDALKAGDAALRFSNRLPPREQTLVRAYNLFQHQRLAATDSARAYVRKYPDDVDGWFLLGETQYHTRQLVGYDAATLRAPFDSVLARDSTLTPASIHPLEVALQSRDKPGYERYLRVLETSGNVQENLAYRGAGNMVFGSAPPDSLTAAAMLRYGGSLGGVLGALYAGDVTGDSVEARYQRWGAITPFMPANGQIQYLAGKGITLATAGRFQDAQRITDSLMKVAPNQAQGISIAPMLLGFAPPQYQPADLKGFSEAPRRNPFQVYITVIFALNHGDHAEGARLSDSLLAHQAPNMPPQLWGMLRAAKGWAVMMKGDTTAGIAAMRSALEEVGAGWNSYMTAPLRLQFAAALTQRPATHMEGSQMLRYSFITDIGATPMALYALGRAEEAVGNRSAAAEAYSSFLRLWNKPDPMLQPRVTEVKEALRRVTGEGK